MKRGRLLLVVPSAYPLGGLATWLDYIVPGLRKLGWDIHVALTSGIHHDMNAYLKLHPIGPVIPLQSRTGTQEGRIRAIMSLLSKVDPDIVGVVNIPDTALAVARLRRAGRFRGRVALLNHGIQATLTTDIARLSRVLDAVVTVNRLAAALAVHLGGMPFERVLYAPGGANTDTTKRSRQIASGDDNPLRLSYVGRIERSQKRAEDLVSLVDALRTRGLKFELRIAGDGPGRAELQDAMDMRGAAPPEVSFTGSLNANQIDSDIYPSSDVVIISSHWETGPLVAWEAMAHGAVLVTSRYVGAGLEGSLRDGENCLMYPVGDMASAADCVARLQDPQLRCELASAASAMVQARYSHGASLARWSAAFEVISSLPERPLGLSEALALEALIGSAGRLDKLLGKGIAETFRAIIGRRDRHVEPGGEWPHTLGPPSDETIFWRVAEQLDQVQCDPGLRQS